MHRPRWIDLVDDEGTIWVRDVDTFDEVSVAIDLVSDTVGDLKQSLSRITGAIAATQRLFYGRGELNNDDILGRVGVVDGACLSWIARPHRAQTMTVFVQSVYGRSITLCCPISETVREFRTRVARRLIGKRATPARLRMVCQGITLGDGWTSVHANMRTRDGWTLEDYNVRDRTWVIVRYLAVDECKALDDGSA